MNDLKLNKSSLILVAVVALAILVLSGRMGGLFSITGATPLSCTQPRVISNDQFFHANKTYSCTMAATGSGQSTQFSLSPDDAYALFGVRTEKTATITTQLENVYCRYNYLNDTTPIFRITTSSVGGSRTPANDCEYCACPSGYVQRNGCPLAPTNPDCNLNMQKRATCIQGSKNAIGAVANLDTPTTEYTLRISMNLDNGSSYSMILTQDLRSAQISNALRAELLGNLQGQFSCPTLDAVVYVPNDEARVYVKSKDTYTALYNNQLSLQSAGTATLYNSAGTQNSLVDNFIASNPTPSQLCTINQTSINNAVTTAFIACDPISQSILTVPLFQLYINGDNLGIRVPQGIPKIQAVRVEPNVEAANLVNVYADIKNEANENDSFDLRLMCRRDISPISSREYIGAQETRTMLARYEASGYISNCNLTVNSVNSPLNLDTTTVRISVAPICGKPQPSPSAIKVNTDKGCQWICPTYKDGKDVIEAGCYEITSYDRCISYQGGTQQTVCMRYRAELIDTNAPYLGNLRFTPILQDYVYDGCTAQPDCTAYLPSPTVPNQEYICKYTKTSGGSCINQRSYNGIHCTGIGSYVQADVYMDGINNHQITPFVQDCGPHKFFVVTDNNVPKCACVNEFGYNDAGLPLDEFVYNPTFGIPSAVASSVPVPPTYVPPLPTTCNNTCGAGYSRGDFPGCACIADSCTNTCNAGETREAFPDCRCTVNTPPPVTCTNTCPAQTTRGPAPACLCEAPVVNPPSQGFELKYVFLIVVVAIGYIVYKKFR